jgi:hypothetical protein
LRSSGSGGAIMSRREVFGEPDERKAHPYCSALPRVKRVVLNHTWVTECVQSGVLQGLDRLSRLRRYTLRPALVQYGPVQCA